MCFFLIDFCLGELWRADGDLTTLEWSSQVDLSGSFPTVHYKLPLIHMGIYQLPLLILFGCETES